MYILSIMNIPSELELQNTNWMLQKYSRHFGSMIHHSEHYIRIQIGNQKILQYGLYYPMKHTKIVWNQILKMCEIVPYGPELF